MSAMSRLQSDGADVVMDLATQGDAPRRKDLANTPPKFLDPLVAALARAVARQGEAMQSNRASP